MKDQDIQLNEETELFDSIFENYKELVITNLSVDGLYFRDLGLDIHWRTILRIIGDW